MVTTMEGVVETWEREVPIDQTVYEGSIHDSLYSAIFRELEERNPAYTGIFGIEKPNRLLGEGETAESLGVIEDFAYTGSGRAPGTEKKGTLVHGEVKSARLNQEAYHEVVLRLDYFTLSQESAAQRFEDCIIGRYLVEADIPAEEVEETEAALEEAVDAGEAYQVPVRIHQMKSGERRDVSEFFGLLYDD